MSKEKKKLIKKIKLKKRRNYSYINAIDEFLDKYFQVYEKLTSHTEGCLSAELYELMNTLLVEDYNASINNLERMSKQSMKYLKKKNSKENSRIFWYKFRRKFGFKVNNEIEELIKKKEQYKLEFAYLFEDIISSKIRNIVDFKEEDLPEMEEEPDYEESPDKLIKGPSEERSLYGEVVNEALLEQQKLEQLTYEN